MGRLTAWTVLAFCAFFVFPACGSGAWGKLTPLDASRTAPDRAYAPQRDRDGNGPSKDSLAPAKSPEKPATPPSKEEKNDCDDCVIVRAEDGAPSATAGSRSRTALAGTLWGLFLVSRPRRAPRTIIRGVTVP
jgi:hypothetical protein